MSFILMEATEIAKLKYKFSVHQILQAIANCMMGIFPDAKKLENLPRCKRIIQDIEIRGS